MGRREIRERESKRDGDAAVKRSIGERNNGGEEARKGRIARNVERETGSS